MSRSNNEASYLLFQATNEGNLDMCRALVKSERYIPSHEPTTGFYTPLHEVKTLELAIFFHEEVGINLDCRCRVGMTPIETACYARCSEVVEYFLNMADSKGTRVDVNILVRIAIFGGNTKMLLILLHRGIPPSETKTGHNILHLLATFACHGIGLDRIIIDTIFWRFETAKLLFERNAKGKTPLEMIWASRWESKQLEKQYVDWQRAVQVWALCSPLLGKSALRRLPIELKRELSSYI
jgi:hypothetical protein